MRGPALDCLGFPGGRSQGLSGFSGDGEQSAGNDVRRLVQEGPLPHMLAEKNMKTIAKADFQRIVTTDPHTYHALKYEYGRFGLDKPVLHYKRGPRPTVGAAAGLGRNSASAG